MKFSLPAITRLCAILLALCASNTVSAQVLNSANGHYYQSVAVNGGITWPQAEAAARAMQYQGLAGHLVSITSAEEQQFVTSSFASAVTNNFWIGGKQASSSVEPAGGWAWSNGEPWSYTAWNSGEPNNAQNNEDSLSFAANGLWNDAYGQFTRPGYIVEYDTPFIAELSSVTLSTNSIVGGTAIYGTVSLTGPAPVGGATIELSQNTASATLPSTVTVPQGKKSEFFTVTTTGVSTPTALTVTAAWNDKIVTDSASIVPVGLKLLTLCPATIVGGNSTLAVIVLVAPSSQPTVVTLTASSNAVRIPATVTLPAGKVSVTFQVVSTAGTRRSISITGTAGGQQRSASLLLLPAP